MRALFNVPMQRRHGIATLWDGSQISEKKLDETYLSLKERVEFRKRVFMVSPTFISFPKWDVDGPDIQFFQTKIGNEKDIFLGPWILDGRKLVADAKDIGLLIAEAAIKSGGNRVQILNPFPFDFKTQRGWGVGKNLFYCFWTGIRKAAECVDIQFVAISDVNPYCFECKVEWKTSPSDELIAVPCDPFAFLGSTEIEKPFLQNINLLQSFFYLQSKSVYKASLCATHRNPFWNPRQLLQSIKYKTK